MSSPAHGPRPNAGSGAAREAPGGEGGEVEGGLFAPGETGGELAHEGAKEDPVAEEARRLDEAGDGALAELSLIHI